MRVVELSIDHSSICTDLYWEEIDNQSIHVIEWWEEASPRVGYFTRIAKDINDIQDGNHIR